MNHRRLGVLGRADHGGLACQSLAVARHMHPAAALVIDMSEGNRGRGPFNPAPWVEALGSERVLTTPFPIYDEAINWLLNQVDVVYAAEGPPPGRDDFPDLCAARGVEFVIHVNPELWRDRYRGPSTRLALPTDWHADRFPDAVSLPMPVDRARFPFEHRTHAATFLHVGAPAFHDRNGSDLVRDALTHVEMPITMLVRGLTDHLHTETIGKVAVHFLPPVDHNTELFPSEADVLVMPRRYGGQSLSVNEALSLGIPALMLDLPPLASRPGVLTVPPLADAGHQHMIGGEEQVWDADPRVLAKGIDWLASDSDRVARASKEANRWAETHSWEALKPVWCEVLGVKA